MSHVFPLLLRTLRTKRRLSQAQLAKRIGVDHSCISRWECGNRIPDRPSIEELVRGLGLGQRDADYLLLSCGYLPDDIPDESIVKTYQTIARTLMEARKEHGWDVPESARV